jgi:hypothetical protein
MIVRTFEMRSKKFDSIHTSAPEPSRRPTMTSARMRREVDMLPSGDGGTEVV